MTLLRLRTGLLAMFCLSLCAAIGSLFWLYLDGAIYKDTFVDLMTKIVAIYSVQLSVVIGGTFSKDRNRESEASIPGWAMALVFIWNIIIAGGVVAFAVNTVVPASLMVMYLDRVGGMSAFLVTGVLAYYFAK